MNEIVRIIRDFFTPRDWKYHVKAALRIMFYFILLFVIIPIFAGIFVKILLILMSWVGHLLNLLGIGSIN